METIKLPETDLTDMRRFYLEELDKTLKRLQHIKSILDKLDDNGQSIQIQITTPQLKASEPQSTEKLLAQVKERKKKQKRKPKSIWEDLVVKRLRHIDKPLTYEELTDEIMTFGNLPEEKRKSTKQAIVGVVFRLRKRKVKLNTFSIGTKEKYIALKRWFDTNGEIKEQYRGLLTAKPKIKKTIRKTKPTSKVAVSKNKKRSTWAEYVLEMLRLEDKPLLVKTMTERAMEHFNIDKKLFGKTRVAVARSMSQLDKKDNKVNRHIVNGTVAGYYGLTDWFNETGDLKKEYVDKIPHAHNKV